MLDEYFTVPPPAGVAAPLAPAPVPVASPWWRRTTSLLAVGGLLVATGVLVRASTGPAPVVLPDTLAGLPWHGPERDFATAEWKGMLKTVYGNTPFDGRGFGATSVPATVPMLNLVVVAGNGRGLGDLDLAGPAEQRFGEVSCTQSLQFDEGAPAKRQTRMALCWRASDDLTVSVFALLAPEGYAPTAAAAVQDVWDRNT